MITSPSPIPPYPPAPPITAYPSAPGNSLHPPAPPIAPPDAYAPPPTGYVADRRTQAPTLPDGYAWPDDPAAAPPAAAPDDEAQFASEGAFDVWQDLLTGYIETRNIGMTAAGEAFPETTAGDVRRVAARLSRELCHPRYDLAGLVETRAAWRDALARADALCARTGWLELYPENERFWLSDSLALAQRLAVVDTRRNAIVHGDGGLLEVLGDRSDPLTTWQDLAHFYRARRPVRTDVRGLAYPETTIGDVIQVARVIDQDARRTIAMALPYSAAASALRGRLGQWRTVAGQLEVHAVNRPLDDTYAWNAAFWRTTRRLAIWLSVARDLARSEADDGTVEEAVR